MDFDREGWPPGERVIAEFMAAPDPVSELPAP
jgi:hypothetical protein